MKTSTEARAEPTPGPLGKIGRAWNRFWFTTADPTLLGLIRLCCGAITLYTIVAYSFTLQELFGKDAWVNYALSEDIRHNRPVGPLVSGSEGWNPASPESSPVPQNELQQKFLETYRERYKVDPPPPLPRNEEEANAIYDFCERWNVDPRLLSAKGDYSWSLWFHVTDPVQMAVLHACICIIVFLFTIGLCTRITSVLTWAAALGYIHRSPITLFGVDTMMTILLLYLMIGPSGAALSVDRWLARWWAQARPRILARWRAFWRGDLEATLPPPTVLGPPQPSVSANFALRLLQIHVCIIYLAAGLSKLQGNLWWNGNAVWWTLANFEFAPMQYESYMAPLRLLASNRILWEVAITSAGIFTLFFEISYTFLVWRPSTRWLILGMAIVLHGFIGIFMGLKTFSLMMLVMNMAFLRPPEVSFLLRPFTRQRPATPDQSETVLSLQPAGAGAPSGAFRPEPKSLPTGARERMKRK